MPVYARMRVITQVVMINTPERLRQVPDGKPSGTTPLQRPLRQTHRSSWWRTHRAQRQMLPLPLRGQGRRPRVTQDHATAKPCRRCCLVAVASHLWHLRSYLPRPPPQPPQPRPSRPPRPCCHCHHPGFYSRHHRCSGLHRRRGSRPSAMVKRPACPNAPDLLTMVSRMILLVAIMIPPMLMRRQ